MSSALSRSSLADPVAAALRAGVTATVARIAATGRENALVLVDGRSGSGKTSFTSALVGAWPAEGRVQTVALDSVYPGWDGLAEGAAYALEHILVPFARGVVGTWRRWDWAADVRAEVHTVDPALALVVEGAGILTPRTAALSDVRVWIDSPTASRRARALARDGDTYAPHWERWAGQEEAHLRAHAPRTLATEIVRVP